MNILAFHLFLEKGVGLMPGVICAVLEIFLVFAYRSYFLPLFTMNAKPGK